MTASPEARRVFRAYIRAVALAEPLLRELAARHRISLADFHALRTLSRLGDVPISRLGAELAIPRSTQTNLVDRLEAAGLVERTSSPTDRRLVVVGLTAAGIRAVGDTGLFRDSLAARRVLALDPDDQRALAALLERLVAYVALTPAAPQTDEEGSS
jgi:DNA-binding MarR family transcriptional regulator